MEKEAQSEAKDNALTLLTLITVSRMYNGEEFDVVVQVEGKIRSYTSANPNESGDCIEDIQVIEPKNFKLTEAEHLRAVEQLERYL